MTTSTSTSTSTSITGPQPNPLADTLSPTHRRCWALAGAIDRALEGSRLHWAHVSFDPLASRPWWHVAALADAGGWEVQAGRWVLSLDRPCSH